MHHRPTETSQIERLRSRCHGDRSRLDCRAQRREWDVGLWRVDEIGVNFIRDDDEIEFFNNLRDRLELRAIKHVPSRILWVTQQQRRRLFRRNHRPQLIDIKGCMNKSSIHIGQRLQKRMVRRSVQCNCSAGLSEHADSKPNALQYVSQVVHPVDVDTPSVF